MLEIAPVRTGNSAEAEIGSVPPKKLLITGVISVKSQVIATTLIDPRLVPVGKVGIGGLWPPASACRLQFKPAVSRRTTAS